MLGGVAVVNLTDNLCFMKTDLYFQEFYKQQSDI